MPGLSRRITVIKRNAAGEKVVQYEGIVLRRRARSITLRASFNREDMPFMDTVLKTGDVFIETYYTNRWYNIFEIHDLENDRLKGWYCNIGRPMTVVSDDRISYIDLALDLWVAPDGTQTVLDEDEFANLALDASTQSKARSALKDLKKRFSTKKYISSAKGRAHSG